MSEVTLDYGTQIARAILRLRAIKLGAALLCKVTDPDTMLADDCLSDTQNPLDAFMLHAEMTIPYPITYRRLPVDESEKIIVAYIERCAEFICEQI